MFAATGVRVAWLAADGIGQQGSCVAGWLAMLAFCSAMNVEVRRPSGYSINQKAFSVGGVPNGFCPRHEAALVAAGDLGRWQRLIDEGIEVNELEHRGAAALVNDRSDRLQLHEYQAANLTRLAVKLNHWRYR